MLTFSFDYITDNVCGFINFELLLYQDAEININRLPYKQGNGT